MFIRKLLKYFLVDGEVIICFIKSMCLMFLLKITSTMKHLKSKSFFFMDLFLLEDDSLGVNSFRTDSPLLSHLDLRLEVKGDRIHLTWCLAFTQSSGCRVVVVVPLRYSSGLKPLFLRKKCFVNPGNPWSSLHSLPLS